MHYHSGEKSTLLEHNGAIIASLEHGVADVQRQIEGLDMALNKAEQNADATVQVLADRNAQLEAELHVETLRAQEVEGRYVAQCQHLERLSEQLHMVQEDRDGLLQVKGRFETQLKLELNRKDVRIVPLRQVDYQTTRYARA